MQLFLSAPPSPLSLSHKNAHTRHILCLLPSRLAQDLRLDKRTHTYNRCPLTLIHIKRARDGRPESTGLPASWHCVPLGQAAALPKYPFVLGGITKQWPSRWCGTRTATHPPGLWPKQVDQREGLVVAGGWRGGMRRRGRGEKRLHLSPTLNDSLGQPLPHMLSGAREARMQTQTNRWREERGVIKSKIDQRRIEGFWNCQISCIRILYVY